MQKSTSENNTQDSKIIKSDNKSVNVIIDKIEVITDDNGGEL